MFLCVFFNLFLFHSDKEKSSSSGLKRTLSEGNESDEPTVKKEGKRPKVEHEELEAQLELKITAKAGNKHKLEKVCNRLKHKLVPDVQDTFNDQIPPFVLFFPHIF